jgi:hypothetical protein
MKRERTCPMGACGRRDGKPEAPATGRFEVAKATEFKDTVARCSAIACARCAFVATAGHGGSSGVRSITSSGLTFMRGLGSCRRRAGANIYLTAKGGLSD